MSSARRSTGPARAPTRALSAPPRSGTVRRYVLALGLVQVLLQPPFAVGDERQQMALLAELSRFELASPSDAAGPFHRVDPELERLASSYQRLTANWAGRVNRDALLDDLRVRQGEQRMSRVAAETPRRFGRLASLPLLPGYWLGRALDLSPLAQLYLARLGGLACFALLAGYAVRTGGPLAFALFALSVLPGSLAQAASVSGDGLCSGLSLCFFALLGKGRLAADVTGLEGRGRMALLALLLMLTACQPLFASAALFLLALPDAQDVRPWLRGIRLFALGCGLGALGVLVWLASNVFLADAGGARFLRDQPVAALLGVARGLLQVDSLLITLSAFSGSLVDQARFSGGLLAALGSELVLLLAWGATARASGAQAARAGERWLLVGSLVYALSLLLWLQLTQANAGPLKLDALSARSFALLAPAALLVLSAHGKPTLTRFLTARPTSRIALPLFLLNALAVSALIGRYFAPARSFWPY